NGVTYSGDLSWNQSAAAAQAELDCADVVIVHNGKVDPRHPGVQGSPGIEPPPQLLSTRIPQNEITSSALSLRFDTSEHACPTSQLRSHHAPTSLSVSVDHARGAQVCVKTCVESEFPDLPAVVLSGSPR